MVTLLSAVVSMQILTHIQLDTTACKSGKNGESLSGLDIDFDTNIANVNN